MLNELHIKIEPIGLKWFHYDFIIAVHVNRMGITIVIIGFEFFFLFYFRGATRNASRFVGRARFDCVCCVGECARSDDKTPLRLVFNDMKQRQQNNQPTNQIQFIHFE